MGLCWYRHWDEWPVPREKLSSGVMDTMSFALPVPLTLVAAVQVVWYVGVLYLLIRIWQKVRHLPG